MESLSLEQAIRPPGPEVRASAERAQATRPQPDTESPAAAPPRDGPKTAPIPAERANPLGEAPVSERSSESEGKEADAETLREAAEAFAEELDALSGHTLEIEYSEEASRFVVRIVDSQTGELVKQVPPQELLDLTQRIQEVRGMLFDEKG